ncbi:hypothetical protein PR048_030350 [Dryococelus australis]|uniref:ATP-dependent DNA helicase n=1 Tax=Dryococelus australis TaxID=614101 RepID=A0ABQ9G8Q9_9NEOP|nr:hypothetical protein PR048_030350 [Dryococelus australis]
MEGVPVAMVTLRGSVEALRRDVPVAKVTLRGYVHGSKQEVSDVGLGDVVHHVPQGYVRFEGHMRYAIHMFLFVSDGAMCADVTRVMYGVKAVCEILVVTNKRYQKQKTRKCLSQQSENVLSDDDWEPSQGTPSLQGCAVISTYLRGVRQSAHFRVSQEVGPSHGPVPHFHNQMARSRVRQRVYHSRYYSAACKGSNVAVDAHDMGCMECECRQCGSLFFADEGIKRDGTFMMCCMRAKVHAPPLGDCSQPLPHLLTGYGDDYGIVESPCHSVYIFQIHGQMHHLISGAVRPPEGKDPRYNQLYFIHVDAANAVHVHQHNPCQLGILQELEHLLSEINPLAQILKSMHEVIAAEEEDSCQKGRSLRQVTLTLKPGLGKYPNVYNLPASVNEAAAIFMGDIPTMRNDISTYPKDRAAMQFFNTAAFWETVSTVCCRCLVQGKILQNWFIRQNQDKLRVDEYLDLHEHTQRVPDAAQSRVGRDNIGVSEAFDETVQADIPDRDAEPAFYDLVKTHMLHTKCEPSAPCFRDRSCRFHFPKAFRGQTLLHYRGLVQNRRPDNNTSATIGTKVYNKRHVVSYSPYVLHKYRCHMYVEICSSLQVTRYLYKNIHKGHDSAALRFGDIVRDDVTSYFDCRCVSSPEAFWRLLSFKMADKNIILVRLALYLEDRQYVLIQDNDVAGALERAHEEHTHLNGILPLQLSAQVDSPLWHQCVCCMWKAREKGAFNTISRIHNVSPQANEELLCLRLLQHNVRGPTSFQDLRTVRYTVYPTYKLACMDLLLLDRDDIYQVTMYEVARVLMHNQFRLGVLIKTLLTTGFHIQMLVMSTIVLSTSDAEARCRVFFVDGPGGSGKTFLYNCIIHSLRADGKIVYPVAWTGIASIVLAGGSTSHTLFKLPVPVLQGSVCDISAQSLETEILHTRSLIIWDGSPMASKEAPRSVNRLLRDVTKNDHTKFGLQAGACEHMPQEFTTVAIIKAQLLLHIGMGTCPPFPSLPEGYVELPDFLVLPKNVGILQPYLRA